MTERERDRGQRERGRDEEIEKERDSDRESERGETDRPANQIMSIRTCRPTCVPVKPGHTVNLVAFVYCEAANFQQPDYLSKLSQRLTTNG